MPKQNTTTEIQTARADAYMELEDDVNVVFRQSRLAKIAMDSIFDEVCALCRIAEEHSVLPSVYQLRQLKRSMTAMDDAVIEVENASGRLERIYYANPT